MTRRPAPELVIFDLDEVLVDLDHRVRLRHLEAATGRAGAELHAAIWASDFERRAEAGEHADGAAYLRAFNARIGCDLSRGQWIEARRAAMRLRADVLAFVGDVAARAPVALLTNNGPLLKEALPELLPEVSALFGPRLHASYELGARKPDPPVYTRLVARYGVPPESAILVDDQPANVAGAEAAGLAAVLFRDLAQVRAAVERWLARRDAGAP
ncbi:MAG: HAD-IA family hydrolase [Minicystis sp.]